MSEWTSVYDSLPDDNEPVWIYWRDREVVIGWKTYRHGDASEDWYSYQGGDKCRWAKWWMPIDLKNRPSAPNE